MSITLIFCFRTNAAQQERDEGMMGGFRAGELNPLQDSWNTAMESDSFSMPALPGFPAATVQVAVL